MQLHHLLSRALSMGASDSTIAAPGTLRLRGRSDENGLDARFSRFSGCCRVNAAFQSPPAPCESRRLLFLSGARIKPSLRLLKAIEKNGVIGDGFLDKLFEQEKLGAVDDGVNALLECLHRRKGLEGLPEKDDRRMASLTHRHVLKGLKREVFADVARSEK